MPSKSARPRKGGSTPRATKKSDSRGILEGRSKPETAKNGQIAITWQDPHALKPYEKNAMVHLPEQIQQVAKSITEYGFTNPVLVDEDNMILAGHARREASLELKLPRVPTIIMRHLTDAQ